MRETEQILLEDEFKICRKCGESKSLSEYYSTIQHSNIKGAYKYYFLDCKKCSSQNSREWRKRNPEVAKAGIKKYNESPIARARKNEANRKRLENGLQLNWQRNNKDKLISYQEKRSEKRHDISADEWLYCKEYFNNSCAYCGLSAELHFSTYKGKNKITELHKEHVDHEGSNDIANCVPSCKRCNSSKRTMTLDEWYSADKNKNFTVGRYDKILKWLNGDYKK